DLRGEPEFALVAFLGYRNRHAFDPGDRVEATSFRELTETELPRTDEPFLPISLRAEDRLVERRRAKLGNIDRSDEERVARRRVVRIARARRADGRQPAHDEESGGCGHEPEQRSAGLLGIHSPPSRVRRAGAAASGSSGSTRHAGPSRVHFT